MKLCVIIPAKDEEVGIGKTIQSILAADVAPMDVYVIDDGSGDQTSRIAVALGVNVMRNEVNQGKARSIKRVCSEYELLERYGVICLMDADTAVSPNYFREVHKGFEDPKVVAVCGRPMSVPYNWLTAYRCLGYFWTHMIYRGAQSKMGVINVAPGCASSYRSETFQQLDWNKDTLVEDMDVTIQIHRKNLGKIVYRPEAIVYTQDPRTLRDYTKQMNRWYTGTWQIAKKHRVNRSWKKIDLEFKLLMGEGLLFSLGVLALPFLALWRPRQCVEILVLDMCLTFVVASFCGVKDRRWDVILAVPMYTMMRFVDCAVLLHSFLFTVILRRRSDTWFSVKRY
jgi:biofilm PGA synthesis N-glycosyltransferase PgaC